MDYYDRGAYCSFFGFAVALPLALIIMSYFLLPGRNSRFYVGLYFETVATALGIAYFTAFYALNKTASNIAWSILILIIVNLFISFLDIILKFRRPLHSFHLLLAHACLWVGCIACVDWYRDYNRAFGYTSWEAFTFIAMWAGAMIALPFPPLVDYLFFYRGYLVPDEDLTSVTTTKKVETAQGTEVVPGTAGSTTESMAPKEVAQNPSETSPLRGRDPVDPIPRDQTTVVNEGDFENPDAVKLHPVNSRS
jgi:hypothetical protein